jgi:hypothetical protein
MKRRRQYTKKPVVLVIADNRRRPYNLTERFPKALMARPWVNMLLYMLLEVVEGGCDSQDMVTMFM